MPLKRSCSFFLNFGIGNCSLGQFPGGNHGRLVFLNSLLEFSSCDFLHLTKNNDAAY